jgi:hypothetical protein
VGNSASCVQTISFSDTQAPVITCPPTANVPCGSSTDPSVTGSPTVSDNCTPTPQIMVAFSDQAAGDQILRTWTATDQVGNAASCVQTINFSDTQPPTISCPPTATVPCGSSTDPSVTGSPTVSDNCTPTPQIMVAFSDQAAGDQILRTWTATDLAGNAASCVQTISFSDTQAPVITCPANAVLPTGTPPTPNNTGNPTATDNCTATPQIALTFSDQTTGSGCAQVITRTWIATDLAGNAASCVQTISFSDTQAPVITCPANAVLPTGTPPTPNNTGNPTATDNCTATPQIALTFSDQTTGSGCSQIIQRTWIATDLAGNAASCVQTISFSDTQAPTITCPVPATRPCGSSLDPSQTGAPTAVDNCTPPPQITFSFTDQGGGTGCAQTIMRLWTAVDASGNASSCTQQIQVIDSEPPVILCPPNITVSCGQHLDIAITGTPIVNDACGNPVDVVFSDDLSEFNNCEGLITRTWLSVDICGNSSSCQQLIFVTLTLQDPQPKWLFIPVSHGALTDIILETLPETVTLQLPENPNLVLQGKPGYSYAIPTGIGTGISWRSKWQLWAQLRTTSGQVDMAFEDQSTQTPLHVTIPFSNWDSRMGIRYLGKKSRVTPFLGIGSQYIQNRTGNSAAHFGASQFPLNTVSRHAAWRVYMETGFQLQAGKRAYLEYTIKNRSNIMLSDNIRGLTQPFGMGLRLVINP